MNEYRMYDGDMAIIPNEPQKDKGTEKKKIRPWVISIIVIISILFLCVVMAVSFLFGARLSGKLARYAYRTVTCNNIVVTIPSFDQSNAVMALESVVNVENQNDYGNILGYDISVGSGAIIREDGLILTTLYAMDNVGDITVRLNNGEKYKAVIYKRDTENNVCILKIDAQNLIPIKMGDSAAVKIGDAVSVIGNPIDDQLSNPIAGANIAGIDNDVSVGSGRKVNVFQVDSPIIANSLGGLVLNKNGELIGISTGIFTTRASDIGIVTPINEVIKMFDEGKNDESVANTEENLMIGISGSDTDHGVVVEDVQKDSPAEKAGLKVDDLIVKADGTPVTKIEEINKIKNTHKKGDIIKITVYRNGEILELDITL